MSQSRLAGTIKRRAGSASWNPDYGVPVILGSERYPSLKAFAEAYGRTGSTLSEHLRRGRTLREVADMWAAHRAETEPRA